MTMPEITSNDPKPKGCFDCSIQGCMSYLYSRLPMFSRMGAEAIKADLINTQKFCGHLSEPQKKFKSVHISRNQWKGLLFTYAGSNTPISRL